MKYFDSLYSDFVFPDDRGEVEDIIRTVNSYLDVVGDSELRREINAIVEKNRRGLNRRVQDIMESQFVQRDGEAHWDSYNDSHYHDRYYDRYDDYGDNSYYHDEYRDAIGAPLVAGSPMRGDVPCRNRRVQDIMESQLVQRDGEAHWDSYNDSHYHDRYYDRYDDYGDNSYYHDEYRDAIADENAKPLQKVLTYPSAKM